MTFDINDISWHTLRSILF